MAYDGAAHRYAESFTARRRPEDARAAEEWARGMFERAPRALRLLLLCGWRVGLGLRLGPLGSPDFVLGWRIAERETDRVRLTASSWPLDAVLELELGDDRVVVASTVVPRHVWGQLLWAAALPLHRVILPMSLRRASGAPDQAAAPES